MPSSVLTFTSIAFFVLYHQPRAEVKGLSIFFRRIIASTLVIFIVLLCAF
jgi:hypothetical protein